jgi:flagellar biosynthetic protein FliP
VALILCLVGLAWSGAALAQESSGDALGLNLLQGVRQSTAPQQVSTTLMVMILVTVLSLAPAIILMTTPFLRIIVVLGFLRQAMATQQSPPNQVLIGIALFLTFFIMRPTYQQVYDNALTPYVQGQFSSQTDAFNTGMKPIRDFMFKQVNAKDLAFFIRVAKMGRPATPDDVPTLVLIPSYILTELRISFQIGFIIYIPFLIIDMVVASTLMAMGMMMLPPIFVSLPFKIIMFVLADGWRLLLGSLVRSFN